MWDSSMGLSIPRSVKANLRLIVGNNYETFLYENLLLFKEALQTKIGKLNKSNLADKHYTTFSKSYPIPGTTLKLKFHSSIALIDYSKAKTKAGYQIEPRVTYIKVTIPALQGTDHFNFNDLINKAISHVFEKEILGKSK